MNTKNWLATAPLALLLAFLPGCQSSNAPVIRTEVHGETVNYEAGGAKCVGYVCYDAAVAGKRPGVLVVHEWWGLNDYVRRRAHMLAEAGYVALAVDMYGGGKEAAHPDDAQKFASAVFANMEAGAARFRAARELLQAHPAVDPEKIGAIGYCFGGAIVLGMARAGEDLDAVASFHGSLGTDKPAKKGEVKARVLVCHGSADQFIPQAQVDAFKKEMADAGVTLQFVTYTGAKHGFTSTEAEENGRKFGLPIGYDAAADRDSWEQLMTFLRATWKDSVHDLPVLK